MTPQETRNRLLGERLIKRFAQRHIEAFYCATRQEAVEKTMSLMPDGSSVSWGGSMTLRDMGLTAAIHAKGTYEVIDRDMAADRAEAIEMYHKALSVDYYLSSANAVSEDGVIVNIDGNGNRVAAITYGPEHVIFVIGMNKICQTVDAAIARARSTAAPINTARFDITTPCKTDGVCHNCNSPECICNYIHLLRNSPRGRHQVVLVGEDLGY